MISIAGLLLFYIFLILFFFLPILRENEIQSIEEKKNPLVKDSFSSCSSLPMQPWNKILVMYFSHLYLNGKLE